MNDITKVAAGPVLVKSVLAVALPGSGISQKTGNGLPVVTKPASFKLPEISELPELADRQSVEEHVKAAVAQMNEYIQSTQRDLHFSYDAKSGETVVKVLDRVTQEVIRQIPDQIFLKLAQNLSKNESLNFLNAQA